MSNLKNSTFLKKIGFPITIGDKEEIEGNPAMYSDTLLEYVINNLIDIDNLNQKDNFNIKNNSEVIVDFTNNSYGELKIKINYSKFYFNLSTNKISSSNMTIFIIKTCRL